MMTATGESRPGNSLPVAVVMVARRAKDTECQSYLKAHSGH